ncbi:hypothetical protein [Micromonospora sicca]|uniref:hypothetical protein n=1 Tax=Micromonospora sicca TaxID=2202420 RepID=UPI00191C4729|nr:hypothetical protein [Micromonospora sp. 4G51]
MAAEFDDAAVLPDRDPVRSCAVLSRWADHEPLPRGRGRPAPRFRRHLTDAQLAGERGEASLRLLHPEQQPVPGVEVGFVPPADERPEPQIDDEDLGPLG